MNGKYAGSGNGTHPNGSPHLHNHLQTGRIISFIVVIALVFLVYVVRLFNLQILNAELYVARAQENSTSEVNTPAPRGIITDRNGVVLARNVPSYNVVLTAAELPENDGAVQEIFRQLSELIDVPVNRGEISETTPYVPCVSDHGIAQIATYGMESKPYSPVEIKCDIDERTARIIEERSIDWPGISIDVQPIREYPTGSLTASIVGFLGPIPAELESAYVEQGLVPNRDKVGYAGLELEFQDILAGINGIRVHEIDVAGQVVREDIREPRDPVPGNNLELTIDVRLQNAAESIFKHEIKLWNDWLGRIEYTSGVVIAMNPKTGEILAMISYPSYENNRMARFIPAYYYDQLINDPTNPLLNHAVGDVVPVGSVFKLVTAVGALNEGVVTPEQILDAPPELIITEKYFENDVGTQRPLVDWNDAGFGQIDFVHAIANSSNVYFYKLGGGYEDEVPGGGLGICRLGTYARALGYGDAPGIGLPDEQDGLVPSPEWKRLNRAESWSSGDTYIASVGQGYVLGTPLQVLLSAATIANNGVMMQPTLIREIVDGEGNTLPVYVDEDGNYTTNPEGAVRQISPFTPTVRWDVTKDYKIQLYGETSLRGCEPIEGDSIEETHTNVQPWVFDYVKEGMRLAVTEGTLSNPIIGFQNLNIPAAGKTGTAEYCDKYALAQNRCEFGAWPTHAWTVAFAPYDDPEIAVVAFVYNGGEGASVAGPIVRRVMQAYFELKRIDTAQIAE
jgi:penicillin-binding protein 2